MSRPMGFGPLAALVTLDVSESAYAQSRATTVGPHRRDPSIKGTGRSSERQCVGHESRVRTSCELSILRAMVVLDPRLAAWDLSGVTAQASGFATQTREKRFPEVGLAG